jgi:hypothetical protein
MRFLSSERSRAGVLLVAISLIGGTGCITASIVDSVQQRNREEATRERIRTENAAMLRDAPQGNLVAITRLGWFKVLGQREGIAADPQGGLAVLEQAAAQGDATAAYALGIILAFGKPLAPAQPARGAELLKRSASHACMASLPDTTWREQTALLVSRLYSTRRNDFPADRGQAQLWYARAILHCGATAPYSLASEGPADAAQRKAEALAWAMLAPGPVDRSRLQGVAPEQVQAAEREALRLRQLVAASESIYPAPPASTRP